MSSSPSGPLQQMSQRVASFHQVRVPLTRPITPLEAYRRLRAAGLAPQLLDGMGAHPDARFAYLTCHHDLEVRVRAGRVEERRPDGTTATVDEPPLPYLRRVLDATRQQVEERCGFTGGWIGYFGYEAHALFESTLPARSAATPDILLRRVWTVAVFDRQDGQVTLYSAGEEEREAERRADEAVAALASGPADPAEHAGPAMTRATGPPEAPAPRQAPIPLEGTGAGDPLPPATAWHTSMDQNAFEEAVGRMRARIAEGDLFQANLATRFQTPCDVDPADLFAALQAANPSPFMALLELDDHAVVSASPEQLLRVQDRTITSRPIAGTRPRGRDAAADDVLEVELRSDEKERAEHTMLVDLVRNDVAKVSVPGTVRVPEWMSVERYRHVMHLASRVEGRVRPGTGFLDWMAALFPGGTITGAPKHRACMRIHETEPVRRGPYTGSAGYLSWSHNTQWNILIRTLVLQDGIASVHAGSGIVADSDPTQEWHEAGHKAHALLDAATGQDTGGSRSRLGEATRHDAWSPAPPPARFPEARALLVDNYDSFTYNLADQCAALGAAVRVIRNDADWRAAVDAFAPTHIILSPGPGHPDDAGCCVELVRVLRGRLPILGVCLGHQAIARALGGRVAVGRPVHGKTAPVHREGEGLLDRLPASFQAARYHSLHVPRDGVPSGFRITATLAGADTQDQDRRAPAPSTGSPTRGEGRSEAGMVMAMEDAGDHIVGLQFHPESMATPLGLQVLAAFMARTR